MADWRYSLKCGTELREAIHDEDYDRILDNIETAWKEIHKRFPDEYEDYELECDLEDLEAVREYPSEEEIDYLLSNLYDYCDATRIWVAL